MKIAITAATDTPQSDIDTRFGRATWLMVFDDACGTWEAVNNIQSLQAAQGAGIQSAAKVVNAGCAVLISGHCGPKAFTALSKAGVNVYLMKSGTVKTALDSFRGGLLQKLSGADVEGHW